MTLMLIASVIVDCEAFELRIADAFTKLHHAPRARQSHQVRKTKDVTSTIWKSHQKQFNADERTSKSVNVAAHQTWGEIKIDLVKVIKANRQNSIFTIPKMR
jgi:predicted membrane protein